LLTINLHSQECHKAAWAKGFGGNAQYTSIFDGDRLADGRFVVLGSFGNAPLSLDTFNLPALGTYNVFLAIHDSSGAFHAAVVIAWCSSGYLQPTALDAGLDGRIHITGYWESSSAHLNGNPLPSNTRERVFASSYNADLSPRWHRVSDWMSADCRSWDVSGGPDGGVYIGGWFEDNAFKIGDSAVENAGGWNMWSDDAYFVKFDSTGAVRLMRSLGTPQDDGILTITALEDGNFIITGATSQSTSTFKFDDQTGRPGSTHSYGMFLGKYDGSTGKCLWGHIGGGLTSYSRINALDACRGNDLGIFITGQITGTVSLPPKSFAAIDGDAYLARVDSTGRVDWLEVIGGQNSNEQGVDCSFHNGRVSVAGSLFSNQTYVGKFPLFSTLSSMSFDAFNAMYQSNGTLLWARGNNSASSSNFFPSAALIDDDGNQLYWGSFKSTQTWYPVSLSNSFSNYRLFLVRFVPSSPAAPLNFTAGPDMITSCYVPITLAGSVSPSNTPFGWYPDLGFSSNNDITPYVYPKEPTDYVLHAHAQGCTWTDSVHVSLSNYGGLHVQTASDTSFCRGGSVMISGASSTPGVSYTWTPAFYLSTDTSQTVIANPPYPVDYVVTAKLGNCQARDTIRVSPNPLPYIYLPKQDLYYSYWRFHICDSNMVSVDLGDPGNSYTVTTPALLAAASNNLITLNGIQGGLLKVSAISPEGCLNKDSVNVILHNNMQAPVITGTLPDRTACVGDSLQFPVNITNSIAYPFQYSWYCGWQVDSGNGGGWKDISIWDKRYDIFNYSVGYPNSTYYTNLRIPVVEQGMDGFQFRFYVNDYCSPRAYSDEGSVSIGPKITQHPQNLQVCEGSNGTLSVNSSSPSVSYLWQVFQNGAWDTLVNNPSVMYANGRFLYVVNAQPGFDSTLVRCRIDGCSPQVYTYSNSARISVISDPHILWQSTDDSICEGDIDSFMVVLNEGPWQYQWYSNNSPITYNTSSMCCFNTNKMKFTPVYLFQNNYTYKLRITNSQCGIDTFSAPVRFYVSPSASASWSGGNLNFCENAPAYPLSGGSPTGGTYSGPGVVGTTFYPALAGVGTHTIFYGYTGPVGTCSDSAARTFTVHPLPSVGWPGADTTLCLNNAQAFLLSGASPAGGTYSGPGVSLGAFNPLLAGAGSHILSYTYTHPSSSCTASSTALFILKPDPMVSWVNGDTAVCLNSGPFPLSGALPAGGTYTGNSVSGGIYDPALHGLGYDTVWYRYTDPLTGCSDSVSAGIYVDPCTSTSGQDKEAWEVSVADHQLLIRGPGSHLNPAVLVLMNLAGQQLSSAIVPVSGELLRLDVSSLSPGIYFISIKDRQSVLVRKVIIP